MVRLQSLEHFVVYHMVKDHGKVSQTCMNNNNVMFQRPHKKSGEAKKLEKSHARDKKLGHFDCSLRQ